MKKTQQGIDNIKLSVLTLSLGFLFVGMVHSQTPKRGLGMSTATTTGTWHGNIVNSESHWYYTWGTTIPEAQEPNMPASSEFVPMFWGAGNVNTNNINKLINLKNQGKIKYVLGFNEPDLSEEANMTVEQALNLWPQLESIGLPLVSPATSYPSLNPDSWFVQFMDGVQTRGLRVDYIAVHLYVGGNPGTYIKILQDVYAKYGKPIWITEFAVRDDNTGGNPANNMYTPEMILTFMQNLLPQLEALDFVYRYAWFNPSPTMAGLWPCALFNQNGSLNTLGEYYKSVPPNSYTLYEAEDASISGAVINSQNQGFTGSGYADYINNAGDYVQWTVNVAQAGAYPMEIKYGLASGSRPLEIRVNGNVLVSSLPFPSTGSWTTWRYTAPFVANLVAGNNTVRATSIGSNGGNLDHLLITRPSNLPPSIQLTSPASGTVFSSPANITLSANAFDPDGSISKVEFYNGTTLIATRNQAPYTIIWNNVQTGMYPITAKAYDNQGASNTSEVVSLHVEQPDISENLALNKNITALSIQGSSYQASKANDGLLTSRWSSAFSDPQWIMVDLGEQYSINQVVLRWQNASAKTYTVEVSNNASFSTKTIIGQVVNGPSGAHVATFSTPLVTGRYVRMHGTARNTSYGYSLFEIEVYGVGLKTYSSTGQTMEQEKSLGSDMVVFPNPTNSEIGVTLGKGHQFYSYEIIDLTGKVISFGQIDSEITVLKPDIARLVSGIYFIRIAGIESSHVLKFIKQ